MPYKKKKAFLQGDKVRVRELKKVFRREARLVKIKYKDKMEKKLTSGNAREAWQGLNIMMSRASKPAEVDSPDQPPEGYCTKPRYGIKPGYVCSPG